MGGMEKLISWLDGERGRRKRLAESLGILPGALSQWKRVPADRAEKVADITGIPAHELRPDVFRDPAKVAA